MTTNKMSATAGACERPKMIDNTVIVPPKKGKRHSEFYNACLKGSYVGAFLALIYSILYDAFFGGGAVMSMVAVAYLVAFTVVNRRSKW